MIWQRIRSRLDLYHRNVIGLNERNVRLVAELNPRRLVRLANDKSITKKLASDAGIPTPKLVGLINNTLEIRNLEDMLDHPQGVAIKPANGAQGNGILVITKKGEPTYRLSNGRRINYEDLRFHVANILSGMYSLSGRPDTVLIEERVRFSPIFDDISFRGVPDIRIIVLKGVPILAMLRLPTSESDGKANLHKGGVGVGLNLDTGVSTFAMQHDRRIDCHPDSESALSGFQVPFWNEMLVMAARAFDVTGLGYLGVDIVVDDQKGPLLLELNGRPGLAIQIANRFGMRSHIDCVLQAETNDMNVDDRVQLGRAIYNDLQTGVAG
ncbi:MAG: alpha-L-glutamate ligase-like protein [Henriciella sp.]